MNKSFLSRSAGFVLGGWGRVRALHSRVRPPNDPLLIGRFTVKREILCLGLLFFLVILLVFGALFSQRLFDISIDSAHRSVREVNSRTIVFTESFFAAIFRTLHMLADNPDVQEITRGNPASQERALDLYRSVLRANEDILYVYSGYINRYLLINDYTPPAGFDPTQRPWYLGALDSAPDISPGIPYREANSGEWVIAPSKILRDSEGNLVGVVAIDISLDRVSQLLLERNYYESQRSFVLDRNGTIIIHPDEDLIGTTLSEIPARITRMKNGFAYTANGRRTWAHCDRIASTGWLCVTAVDSREILAPILMQVLFYLLIVVLVAAFLGWLQSRILGRRLADPLCDLGNRVAAIAAGKPKEKTSYADSNREIAMIAENIERLTESSLSKRTNELKTIIESTQDGILVAGAKREIIYLNSRFKEIWRLEEEDLAHLDDAALNVAVGAQLIEPEVAHRKFEGLCDSPTNDVDTLYFKDGRVFEIFSCPLINQGQVIGRLWNFRDFTARKQAEQLIAAKNKELEQLVHAASHDLRAPLVNVDGWGRELEFGFEAIQKALQEEPASVSGLEKALRSELPDMADALTYIRQGARQMDTLLKGLQQVSRSGRSSLSISPLDMNGLIARVVSTFECQAKATGAQIILTDLPYCKGDEIQVSLVFSNLLENALKFLDPTRPGVITITGAIRNGRALYCVEDNGIGIASEYQEIIFELFHRLDPSKTEGAGLGLTLVRQILGRLDGEIRVASRPGEGSQFHVTLPCL